MSVVTVKTKLNDIFRSKNEREELIRSALKSIDNVIYELFEYSEIKRVYYEYQNSIMDSISTITNELNDDAKQNKELIELIKTFIVVDKDNV